MKTSPISRLQKITNIWQHIIPRTKDIQRSQVHEQEQSPSLPQPYSPPEEIAHPSNSSPSIEHHTEGQLNQDLLDWTQPLVVEAPGRNKDQRTTRHRPQQLSKPPNPDDRHFHPLASTPILLHSKGQKNSTDLLAPLHQVQDLTDLSISSMLPANMHTTITLITPTHFIFCQPQVVDPALLVEVEPSIAAGHRTRSGGFKFKSTTRWTQYPVNTIRRRIILINI